MANPINVFDYEVRYFTNGGSREMDVNGSSTPVSFKIETITPGQRYYLLNATLYIEDSSDFDSGSFGGLGALTNGVLFRSGSGPGFEIALLRDNIDILSFFSIHQQSMVLRNDNAWDERHIMVREIFPNPLVITDDLEILIQDNLTGLDFFRVSATIVLIPSDE